MSQLSLAICEASLASIVFFCKLLYKLVFFAQGRKAIAASDSQTAAIAAFCHLLMLGNTIEVVITGIEKGCIFAWPAIHNF